MFDVRRDDLSSEPTRALAALHLKGMHEASPPGAVFALDLSGLTAPDVTLWSAWCGDRLAALGAMKMLADGNAEIKSMRTHPDFLRQGAGTVILATIISAAQAQGARRLSLETGSGPAFEAALSMYQRHGFTIGASFADYRQTDFCQFLHLDLPEERSNSPERTTRSPA